MLKRFISSAFGVEQTLTQSLHNMAQNLDINTFFLFINCQYALAVRVRWRTRSWFQNLPSVRVIIIYQQQILPFLFIIFSAVHCTNISYMLLLNHQESLSQPCLENLKKKKKYIIEQLPAFSCPLHQHNLIKFCKVGY